MNGAAGERRNGRSVTDFTVKVSPASASATEVASSSPRTCTAPLALCCPSSSKSLPVATAVPPSETREAPKPLAASRVNVPSIPHHVAERNRMRARSRSTTIRVATLCTRPAESRGMTLRHRTGDTS